MTDKPQELIKLGRFSDSDKNQFQLDNWKKAEVCFKEQKFADSLEAFLNYIRDEKTDNVHYTRLGDEIEFEILQGSKVIRGKLDGRHIEAEAQLAIMEKTSVAIMRRMLEMSFKLNYCRFALKENILCLKFDTSVESANPNKLFYGLKELATKADKQDDQLLSDFAALKPFDNSHIEEFSAQEKEIKYDYLIRWIKETLTRTSELNQDKLSGGISYLYMALLYRIDYLICPEGMLMD
ncbi:MAG: YbjN domain-containing protein, partial [Bacteroidia bacterium]|nr:YbjN domain-containing protein [Bacteroidia bacterium]